MARKKFIEIKENKVVTTPEENRPASVRRYTFDLYFITTGKPVHHKSGMAAYLSVAQSRQRYTLEEWKKIFKDY